jgi:Trk K+ transport system NAD-binding subunit
MNIKMLVVAFHPGNEKYVKYAKQSGMVVRVLDCVEPEHKRLSRNFGDELLTVQGTRGEVRRAVANEGFDVALVHESVDFILTALITQSLREAGVPLIVVVTPDGSKASMYRRLGAHQVLTTQREDETWVNIEGMLSSFATA